jgi:hypothetical protein
MSGNNSLIIQPRDLQLLQALAVMLVMDCAQAKIVGGFGSTTRVNYRLLKLTRAGLLKRFFLGSGGGRKALYALSPKGALLAQVPVRGPRRPQDAVLVADYFVGHQLAVNQIYCALKYGAITVPHVTFRCWLAFFESVVPGLSLVPDGYVEFTTPHGIIAFFLEVDLGHESQAIWKRKAEHYVTLAVSGNYCKHFGHDRFRVLVITNSERRLHSIRKTIATITQKIFRFGTQEALANDFFAPVWLLPTGDQPTSLIETTS